jgi:putative membrane protein
MGMARSLWMALALLTMTALAGCVPPPPPTAPAPPPAPAAPEAPPAPPAPPTASSDQDFINQAAGMNAREIGMGRLAHGKAAASRLRLFAQHLALEYIELDKRLAALAKHLQLDVAPPPDMPPPVLLTTIGPDFDWHYLELVIKGHESLISLYESEADNGQDIRARHFAREMLPVLRARLAEAEAHGRTIGLSAP